MKESYITFVEDTVRAIVNMPEDVVVEKTADDQGILLLVSVNQGDMGLVIGKEGSTVKALRTLLRTVGMKVGARVSLKVNEPGNHGER